MKSSNAIIEEFVTIGIKKSQYKWYQQISLAFIGGMFIGLAGVGSLIAAATIANPSLSKLLSSLIFPFGLLMIVLTQTELFTSNNLIIISVVEKKNSLLKMIRNLVLVYFGNALGALFIVILLYFANTFHMFNDALGKYIIGVYKAKGQLTFLNAFTSGILCNVLVCFAVWMCYSTKRVGAKLFILFFPTMLFVLSGFEHSIANFFYGPAGIASSIALGVESSNFWSFLIKNIVPATLGNLVGGIGIVGIGTWSLFRLKKID